MSKNSAIKKRGSASFAAFVVLLFAVMTLFFVFYLMKPKNGPPPASTTPELDSRIEKLEGEFSQLTQSLQDVETMKNRSKYLEILGAAEKKLIASDDLWDEKEKVQKGLRDGMLGGINENYEARFSPQEKFQMLSEKFDLPVDKIRALKADVEILFSDELAEKFAPAPADGSQDQGGAQDAGSQTEKS